jgi:hypothetical protein
VVVYGNIDDIFTLATAVSIGAAANPAAVAEIETILEFTPALKITIILSF